MNTVVVIAVCLGLAAARSLKVFNENDSVPHRDCQSLFDAGYNTNGTYRLTLNGTKHLVPCEFYGGKGLTIFLHRVDGFVRWNRRSPDYEDGFGWPGHDFFLGLYQIHQMTQSGSYSLSIRFEDWSGFVGYSVNQHFRVLGPDYGYRLQLGGGYDGNVANDIAYNDGMEFYTIDIPDPNGCVYDQLGGWWYNYCSKVLPTGRYYYGGYYTTNKTWADGIYWEDFKGVGYSLKRFSMAATR